MMPRPMELILRAATPEGRPLPRGRNFEQILVFCAEMETPWTAVRRYRRVVEEMIEEPCAENNQHADWPIPIARTPDF